MPEGGRRQTRDRDSGCAFESGSDGSVFEESSAARARGGWRVPVGGAPARDQEGWQDAAAQGLQARGPGCPIDEDGWYKREFCEHRPRHPEGGGGELQQGQDVGAR